MSELTSVWRWAIAGAVVIAAAGFVFSKLLWLLVALALFAGAAVWCKAETGRWPGAYLGRWWSGMVREWRIVSAWFLQKLDEAPSFWMGAARDDIHAGYRADYERLVKTAQTRADFFLLAEIAHGLRAYGDDPLAKPPRVRGFLGAGAVLGGGFSRTALMGAGAMIVLLLGLTGYLWGRGAVLERERDQACSGEELEGRTSRQACLDLAVAGEQILELDARVKADEAARIIAVERAEIETEATRALNARNAARRRQSADRLRRAHEDDVDAARRARAPDWDSRLRDLANPALAPGEPGPGTAAGDDALGGVSGTGAGPADVRDPAPGAGADPTS